MNVHRISALFGLAIATGAIVSATSPARPAVGSEPGPGARAIVIAELFTSEGCSSCPPADDLLRQLSAAQPVTGVELIALGEHVDYWDRLGWKDSFSSPAFSARQSAYDAAVFHSDNIYTPQLVVDGALQGLASDAAIVRKMIEAAAGRARGQVSVTISPAASSAVQVVLQVQLSPAVARKGRADIVIAVTESELVTSVKHGENGGRMLSHAPVVRSIATVARLDAEASTATATKVISVPPNWKREHLRIVGFVQEQASRRILGAGASIVAPGTE